MAFFKKVVKDELLDEETVKKDKSMKVLLLVAIPVVIIIAMIAIKSLGGGKKTGGIDFYDTFSRIFSSELGTFSYTFDIRTGEKGSLIKSEVANVVDLDTLENQDIDTEEEVDTKYEFSEWEENAEVRTGDWEYPNFQLIVEGRTMSVEPLATTFTINLATQYHNNVLTDVTCFDGNYYINIESLRHWLVSSKDDYLISLGSELPQGSKYLVIPEKDFVAVSRFAEEGEKDFSKVTGLTTMYRRVLTPILTLKDTLKNNVSGANVTTSDGFVSVSMSGDSAVSLLNAVKNVLGRSGDLYSNVIATNKSKGLYNDSQYEQAVREKDNVMSAFSDMLMYMNVADLSAMNALINGDARQFVNGSGNSAIEGNLHVSFSSDTTDYMISVKANRSGDKKDIMLPQGSQLTVNDLVYPTQLGDIARSVIDYFNFTGAKTACQLEITPSNIAKYVENSFIKLVNSLGTYDEFVTFNNIGEFIEKYADFEITEDSEANDDVNARLVQDYLKTLHDLAGGIVIEKEVVVAPEAEKYPKSEFADGDIKFTAKFNEELSDSKLMVIDIEAFNYGSSFAEINTTDFGVRTLLSSTYPANNRILLKSYNNLFDFDNLVERVSLAPSSFACFKLYVVLADDLGHMDLMYKGSQNGVVVEY